MLNHKGEIAECTGDNIFLIKRGVLKTPPPDAGILEGITRGAVLELAQSAGIPTQEIALTRHDVYAADECFLTGTAAEVKACDSAMMLLTVLIIACVSSSGLLLLKKSPPPTSATFWSIVLATPPVV